MPGSRFYRAIGALFLALCLVPAVGFSWLSGPHREKRGLAPAPEIADLPAFPSAFDAWFADRFGLRAAMVTGDHALRIALLGDAGSDRVIAGKKGWLFFEPTLDDAVGLPALSDEAVTDIADDLAAWSARLEDQGSRLVVGIAPNKATVYPEYLPGYLRRSGTPGNLDRLTRALEERGVACAPWADQLLRGKEVPVPDLPSLDGQAAVPDTLYHATDSHWNNRGAFIAYRVLMDAYAAGGASQTGQLNQTGRVGPMSWIGVRAMSGDLAEMLYPAWPGYDVQIEHGLDGYTPVTRIRTMEDLYIETRHPDGAGVLTMYRDSFANALIPYLSTAFETARYSRATPYDLSLTEGADLVVVEIAERNIADLTAALAAARADGS